MALLNIATKSKDDYLSKERELIFTKDRHIITHGIDFLEDYKYGRKFEYDTNSQGETTRVTIDNSRGLVPNYTIEEDKRNGVLSKNGWTTIETDMLPIATNLTDNNTITIFNSLQVKQLISSGFGANDAMVFKGVLQSGENKPTNAVDNLPYSGYDAGWTYRVVTPRIYAGKSCEAGDWIIATIDRTLDDTLQVVTDSDWAVVQTNINGTTTFVINGTEYNVATNSSIAGQTFVAPEKHGTNGLVLKTTGSDFRWSTVEALKPGTGLSFKTKSSIDTDSYDGTTETTVSLIAATASALGGVKTGYLEDLSTSNRNYKIQIDQNGNAFVAVPWSDIRVGGSTIGHKALNFITTPGSNIGIVANVNDHNANTPNTFDVGFDIYWYNLDSGDYEV